MLVPLEKPNFDVRFDSLDDLPSWVNTDRMYYFRELRSLAEEAYVSEFGLLENLNKLARIVPKYPGYTVEPAKESEMKTIRAKLKGIIDKALAVTHKIIPAWKNLYAIYRALPTNGQAAAQRAYKGDINCLVEARKIAENGNDIPADVKRKIVEYETIICDSAKVTRTYIKEFYHVATAGTIPGQAMSYKRP